MASLIRALLFDFDGLILDTESTEMDVWKSIYAEYGFVYPEHRWAENVGLWGAHAFDSAGYLHELTHDSLDVAALRKRHRDESAALLAQQPERDGLQDYLTTGRRLGMRLAVASSSPREWVVSHLTRLGLISRFDRIITGNDVPEGRVKPHPDIYLRALEAVAVAPNEAIAFEDSPYGLVAARAAGIFAVAVRNPSTTHLKLDEANLVLDSFSSISLTDLIQRAIP